MHQYLALSIEQLLVMCLVRMSDMKFLKLDQDLNPNFFIETSDVMTDAYRAQVST